MNRVLRRILDSLLSPAKLYVKEKRKCGDKVRFCSVKATALFRGSGNSACPLLDLIFLSLGTRERSTYGGEKRMRCDTSSNKSLFHNK